MGSFCLKQNQINTKGDHISKSHKKRFLIQNTNNFTCYDSLRLLVSQPHKYFAVHIVILCAMIYFYVLTFVVKFIVYEINYIIIALHAIVFVLNTILGFKNPGIVLKIQEDFDSPTKISIPFDRDSKPAVNQMAKSYSFPIKSHFINLKFCPQCLIYRPPRTVHCWVCNACIIKMDHHCPFIGNCIGKGNYQVFFSYVSVLTIKIMLIIAQLIIMIVRLFIHYDINTFKQPEIYFAFALLVFAVIVLAFVGSLTGFHVFLILNSLTTNQLCKKTWSTISGNPFRKNLCMKNIFRFIKGPAAQFTSHSHQNFQKSLIPRFKDKSQQCFSQYSSQPQPNSSSQIRNLQAQKAQSTQNKQSSNTLQNIMHLSQSKGPSI